MSRAQTVKPKISPSLFNKDGSSNGHSSISPVSFTFFKSKRNLRNTAERQEDVSISGITLHFSDPELETRYVLSRMHKFRPRLRFGALFTIIFIPLLVFLQVYFKSNKSLGNKWTHWPHVIIFPGIVFLSGGCVIQFLEYFQKNPRNLAVVCLIGQISALLDTTAAGTSVSERNVWVQFIFSLGITSSTGIGFLESFFVLSFSSFFFICLAWVRYGLNYNNTILNVETGIKCELTSLSSPGTVNTAVVLYSLLLVYLSWNWEKEERRDFVLTERLAKENVRVQMTMEMTGWFSGGANTADENGTTRNQHAAGGILSANCHIDPKHVHLEEELGSGTFGSVYAATWKETKVAVKKLSLLGDTQKIITSFGAEASVMAQLRHPNIVMFMGVMIDADFVGLVMELCPKGSVYGVIHSSDIKVDWTLLLRMLVDAARGMHFLHTSTPTIIHRDLKSINLLIDADWRCKVSDFGLSELKSYRGTGYFVSEKGEKSTNNIPMDDRVSTSRILIGTYMWLAPEIFRNENHSVRTDVYSFGIILYEALSGQVPFESVSSDAVPFIVQSGKRPTDFTPFTNVTNPQLIRLVTLMEECWQEDSEKRPTFSSIINQLQSILVKYIDKEPWEDHIIFPDRRLNSSPLTDTELGYTLEEKDVIIGEAIGKGVFGAVYRGTYFGTPVAIKKLFVTGVPKDVLADFNKECTIMRRLRHPNIVLFMGSCCNPPNLLLVTELLNNGSFFDIYHRRSKPPKEEHIKLSLAIALDMARGLAYLHNQEPAIIHRDLKSQNIMLDDRMKTKIGDFGLSKFREVGKTMSICGSPLWVAPEVLRGEKYGCSCDVYSFSIIVWEVLAWSEPYPHMGSNDVMNGVACGTLRPIIPTGVPKKLSMILKDCWNQKSSLRPSFNELVGKLEEINNETLPGITESNYSTNTQSTNNNTTITNSSPTE